MTVKFSSKHEAAAWQAALDSIEQINMLSSKFERTLDLESCYYVHLESESQVDAFNLMEKDYGFTAKIMEPGYYYYDEVSDEYLNIDVEIKRLLDIKAKLDRFTK